ncbi:hypothetical protein JCM11641_004095 [Rhodosporidiobolus odoratus]
MPGMYADREDLGMNDAVLKIDKLVSPQPRKQASYELWLTRPDTHVDGSFLQVEDEPAPPRAPLPRPSPSQTAANLDPNLRHYTFNLPVARIGGVLIGVGGQGRRFFLQSSGLVNFHVIQPQGSQGPASCQLTGTVETIQQGLNIIEHLVYVQMHGQWALPEWKILSFGGRNWVRYDASRLLNLDGTAVPAPATPAASSAPPKSAPTGPANRSAVPPARSPPPEAPRGPAAFFKGQNAGSSQPTSRRSAQPTRTQERPSSSHQLHDHPVSPQHPDERPPSPRRKSSTSQVRRRDTRYASVSPSPSPSRSPSPEPRRQRSPSYDSPARNGRETRSRRRSSSPPPRRTRSPSPPPRLVRYALDLPVPGLGPAVIGRGGNVHKRIRADAGLHALSLKSDKHGDFVELMGPQEGVREALEMLEDHLYHSGTLKSGELDDVDRRWIDFKENKCEVLSSEEARRAEERASSIFYYPTILPFRALGEPLHDCARRIERVSGIVSLEIVHDRKRIAHLDLVGTKRSIRLALEEAEAIVYGEEWHTWDSTQRDRLHGRAWSRFAEGRAERVRDGGRGGRPRDSARGTERTRSPRRDRKVEMRRESRSRSPRREERRRASSRGGRKANGESSRSNGGGDVEMDGAGIGGNSCEVSIPSSAAPSFLADSPTVTFIASATGCKLSLLSSPNGTKVRIEAPGSEELEDAKRDVERVVKRLAKEAEADAPSAQSF